MIGISKHFPISYLSISTFSKLNHRYMRLITIFDYCGVFLVFKTFTPINNKQINKTHNLCILSNTSKTRKSWLFRIGIPGPN